MEIKFGTKFLKFVFLQYISTDTVREQTLSDSQIFWLFIKREISL